VGLVRSSQKKEFTWDLTPLYKNMEAWDKDRKKEEKINYDSKTSALRKKNVWTAKDLKDLLDLYFSSERHLRKLYTYAHLLHDEDVADDASKQAFQKIMTRYHAFSESMSFIEPKILSHTKEKIESFLKASVLAPYTTYIERLLRLKAHTLPEAMEALIASSHRALDAPHRAFSAINDADFRFSKVKDSKGKEHVLTHGSYGLLIRSPDRELRKESFLAMHERYAEYENTIAELLHGEIQKHFFEAKARGYATCLEAALHPKNIPVSVYHNLISAVRSNIKAFHRYLHLKKKILRLKVMYPWDLYVPMINKKSRPYTYEKAVSLTTECCSPLGKEYVKRLQEGLTKERWVDVYENENKHSGAYSSGCYDSYPYILLNFTGTLRDVFTLAHEAGHSMHSELTRTTQPYQYSDYATFVAEVASTFTEELMSQKLLSEASDNSTKALLLNERLEDLRATFFRQTLFAEFELFLHTSVEQGEPITPAILRKKFIELNEFYYGDALEVVPELGIEWARIPHFYYNFYVFQYATGISAACALAEKVTKGKEKDRSAYLSFLRGGSSKFPIDLLQEAGVDMTQQAPVKKTVQRFESLVKEFESISTSSL
jgi:oligoendopeptidase F